MPTIKELLSGFCSKTLNMGDVEVAALFTTAECTELKPDALDTMLAKDAVRVQGFNTERQTYFDNGYKKAQKEDRTKFEKEIKEKMGLESDKVGVDLILDLVSKKVNDAGTLTEEQVKAHPLYISTIAAADKRAKEIEKEWKGKLDNKEAEIAKEKSLSSVQNKAIDLVKSLNPILPEDAARAEQQLKWLKHDISAFDYKDENGVIIILKDGEPQKDKHGALISFEDFVKEKASQYWDFKAGDGKSGPQNKTGTQTQTGKKGVKTYKNKEGVEVTINAPKDLTEYSKVMAEAKSGEERIAIQDAWDEANAAS